MSTFSLAFDEGPEYDERSFIAKVRERYPTEHYEITPSMRECWNALPSVLWWMDEPTVASPTVSQYFLSALARQHVVVALGGQGGDELFGGYYRFLPRYLRQVLREVVSLKRPITDLWPTFRNLLDHVSIVGPMRVRTKMKKHATMMTLLSPELHAAKHDTEAELMDPLPVVDPMNRMFYWEIKNYLPGLLHAEDRMSMAVSLESRVPLLDYRVVEFAATIPPELKMRHLVTKYILREAMRGTTPDAVLNRKDKRGTPSPLPKWFGTGLAEEVRAVLLDRRTTERGLFDPKKVERALVFNSTGRTSYGEQIWMLLNVELWYRTFIDRSHPDGPIAL
jgi:asparagine synthase (glutamine-hydrolysing)